MVASRRFTVDINGVPCDDPNEVRKRQGLKDFCRPTCEYRNSTESCDGPKLLSFTCECKPGYILDELFGKCVPVEECRTEVPCDDPNAVRKHQGLKDLCRPTCDYRNFTELCDEPRYLSFACECKPGYVLNDIFGKCVPIEECKTADLPTETTTQISERTETSDRTERSEKSEVSGTTKIPETEKPILPDESSCKENEVFVECSRKCGLHCHIPVWEGCEFSGPCYPRCECKPGYARNPDDECVPEEECLSVPCDDPNAVRKHQGLKDLCRPTCDYRNFTELCDEPRYLSFTCECKPGYVLDDIFGKCVPIEECKTDLPTETTTQISERTDTSVTTGTSEMAEGSERTEMAETEKPILPEESKCQQNEVFVECSRKCGLHCHIPTWDGCELSGPCYPRCECKPGYARNQEDRCIPEEECLSVSCDDPNAVRKHQGLKDLCRPTCEYRKFTQLCDEPMYLNFACECKPGYVLDDIFGKCVPIEECKTAVSCNDPNAVRKLRGLKSVCRPTCEHRNGTVRELCKEPMYYSFACECEAGYILEKTYGKCIPIEECRTACMFPFSPQQSGRSIRDITTESVVFLKLKT
ncbi:hypothetical protein Aduo_013421 [Ancylostoma duodenale]